MGGKTLQTVSWCGFSPENSHAAARFVIAMIMAAFGFGALMMLPDPVKPVESWYDAGHRLDGSFVKPVDPAAAKAEAILKEGMQVGAKAKI